MRFGTIRDRFVLVRDGRALDVATASDGALPADVLDALSRWDEVRAWAPAADWSGAVAVTEADLGPPVPRPRQVFAIALNYRPHAAEAGFTPPDAPLVFTKFPTCIGGPRSTVRLPAGNVDWEIEVVAVIGAGGFAIPHSRAWAAVAGLTCGQDLSERVGQMRGTPPQFSLAKSHPGFGPIGPVAVTPDAFANPSAVAFESVLIGAGGGREVVQTGNTADMIFPVDDLVSRLSQVCTLLPGDLIFTGTPAGVGNRRSPRRFLRPGETLVSRLDGVGEIRQTFVAS
jgi:2-keto-4-pentenoate hydratase/2-oxohepta-3-ene-1,7-dioic acid hydratase in catechol pathway